MSLEVPSSSQYSIFKDCIARRILGQPDMHDSGDESTALDEFSSYLALESWHSLPKALQNASYETRSSIPDVASLPLEATPTSFIDSLISYGFATDSEESLKFLQNVIKDYIEQSCVPLPAWSSTRTAECEVCEREVPLTYHHLIPRSTHAKVLKRKWHPEAKLNSVAWLCRPCHTAVHHIATNEELAQNYYTLPLLLEKEEIQRWKKYAAKQRFGVRRG